MISAIGMSIDTYDLSLFFGEHDVRDITLGVRVSDAERELLRKIADKRGITVAEFCREAFGWYIRQQYSKDVLLKINSGIVVES